MIDRSIDPSVLRHKFSVESFKNKEKEKEWKNKPKKRKERASIFFSILFLIFFYFSVFYFSVSVSASPAGSINRETDRQRLQRLQRERERERERDAMAAPPLYTQWPQTSVAENDEVRTIFVLGFPPDVKERELLNLLRWWPGYEASQMNFKGEQPMGFALFSSAAMAMSARDALQNLVFDPETNSMLRAEMAKKNLYVKHGNGVESAGFDQSKRLRTVGDYPQSYAPPPLYPGSTPGWVPQSYIPATVPYDPYSGYGMQPVQSFVQPLLPSVSPAGYAVVQNTKDNPPCNTLFVGNLGESTNENELRGIFSSQPGFKQMKVLRQARNTVCFIEFLDVNSAIAVHNNLQGAVLASSDRGGMRLQYSKNPFGKKKDSVNSSDGAPGVSDTDGVSTRPNNRDD